MRVTRLATLHILLIVLHKTYSYVVVTANMDDLKGEIRKMVPQTVVEELVEIITNRLSKYYETHQNFTLGHYNRLSSIRNQLDGVIKDVLKAFQINETAAWITRVGKHNINNNPKSPTKDQKKKPNVNAPIIKRVIFNNQRNINSQKTTKNTSIYILKNQDPNSQQSVSIAWNRRKLKDRRRQNYEQDSSQQVERIILSKNSKYGYDINIKELLHSIKKQLQEKYEDEDTDDNMKPTKRQVTEPQLGYNKFKIQRNKKETPAWTKKYGYNNKKIKSFQLIPAASGIKSDAGNKNNNALTLSLLKHELNSDADPSDTNIKIASIEFQNGDIADNLQIQNLKLEYKSNDKTQSNQKIAQNSDSSVILNKPPTDNKIQFEFKIPDDLKELLQSSLLRSMKNNEDIIEEEGPKIPKEESENDKQYNDPPKSEIDIFENDDPKVNQPDEQTDEPDEVTVQTKTSWQLRRNAGVQTTQRPKIRKFVRIEFTSPSTQIPVVKTPDFIKKNVAEKYDFKEPLPEKDREPEKLVYINLDSIIKNRFKLK